MRGARRADVPAGQVLRGEITCHCVVFAWSLPLSMKWRDGTLKYLPKRLLERYLPAPLVHRRKSGFGAPVGDWLRGPLRDWAQAQLDPVRLRQEGHFDAATIGAIWTDFLGGQRKWHTHLWSVLMFQAWREHAMRPGVRAEP